MRSELQIKASQRNGAKSRGPRSATTPVTPPRSPHPRSTLSQSIVIEGENPDKFTALLTSLRTELIPQTQIEDALIEDLAACRWRQRRFLAMETAALSHQIRVQDPQITPGSPASRAANALTALSSTRTLDLISRYETCYNRMYNRTLKTLKELRSASL